MTSNDPRRVRVLCVDDEPQVLEGLALQLGRRYEVLTATSGSAGLEILNADNSVAVIVSDMRMPSMDGAVFLARARSICPSSGRILLTGQTDLASAISAINEGQILRFLTKPCAPSELHAAVEAAVEHHRRATMEQTDLRRKLTARIVSQDVLTGLASRSRFSEVLKAACVEPGRGATQTCAVLLIGLENLREISSIQGRAAGDHVLQAIARRLLDQCKDALCVARWGDDEFAVLLPTNGLDDAGVTALADTLIAMLGMPISQDQGFLRIRANIGIALMPKHAEGAEALEKYASIATHKAKGQGAGVSCMFRPDWAHQAEYRYQLMAALREAIEADELHLHFQPIVDVQRQEVRVFEALARWTHPTLGQIPPNQFITLAEESGEMPALGQWILRRACQQARQLIGVYCGRIAVNISMHQLLHEAFFVHLDDALRISGLQPNELELELTESVFSRDIESVLAAVRALRNRGISIAIDDFGTGYSSLAYLQRFPTDIIKVDRSFANTLGSGGETIIAAAQSIGRSFGMQVVIEGVETEAILLQLRALGLDLFQGYYIAKPMPVGDIDAWFRASPYKAASSGTVITKRPGLTSASGIRSRP